MDKKLTLIKVYENDYDYNYEQYFLVNMTKEEQEQFVKICEDIHNLDYDEREKKYGSESVIECTEYYIVHNYEKVDYTRIDIDTY